MKRLKTSGKELAGVLGTLLLLGSSSTGTENENSLGIKMVGISAGSFIMGDTLGDWDEVPAHRVEITRPFAISETEITVEQYRRFREDYRGIRMYSPYATGISWYEAQEFCEWLSEKEGKQYRLPTEAEWEYVCRAGSQSPFSSGDNPPGEETANAWGVKNMHTGVLEWCQDWYGPYPDSEMTDPVGYGKGYARVVRGGLPDNKGNEYDHPVSFYFRSANRASQAPAFGMKRRPDDSHSTISENRERRLRGLIGVYYLKPDLKNPSRAEQVGKLDSDHIHWEQFNDWSATWQGWIKAPCTGRVKLSGNADNGLKLIINGAEVFNSWENVHDNSGFVDMEKDSLYSLFAAYFQDGGKSEMKVTWEFGGSKEKIIPEDYFFHSEFERDSTFYEVSKFKKKGNYSIGFRIVEGKMPESLALQRQDPFVMQGVRQDTDLAVVGPDPSKPYFRKRYILPVPMENKRRKEIDAAGFPGYFWGHNHCPALCVLPNGDVLAVLYSSNYHEYEPGVSLIATRLRVGEEEWEFPSLLLDLADINDASPLLWNMEGLTYLFFGQSKLDADFPFAWTSSGDNFSSFDDIQFPTIYGPMGTYTAQPINSAFIDPDGNIYIPTDGEGGESVLWTTPDSMQTWYDTGGRTAGRHSTFLLQKDNSILAMGGKNTDIDGYMPKAISADRGKTWTVSKTPFPALATNQRPSILRLKSGHLLFAGDYQDFWGNQPEGLQERGSYVALSEDEGKTWIFKTVPGAQVHENPGVAKQMKGSTLGYSVAVQGENGMIHLIATMNHPCLAFEFNEAWILSDTEMAEGNAAPMVPDDVELNQLATREEKYTDGNPRIRYQGGLTFDGRFLLEGRTEWFYENGTKEYEAEFHLGRKTGLEKYFAPDGKLKWEKRHRNNMEFTWIQYREDGTRKAESEWKNWKCDGMSRRWDRKGRLIEERAFVSGNMQE